MKNVSHFTFLITLTHCRIQCFLKRKTKTLKVWKIFFIVWSVSSQLCAFSFTIFIPDSTLGLQCQMLYFFSKGFRWLSYHHKQLLPLSTHATVKYPCTFHHGYTSASHGGTAELSSALTRASVNRDCRQSQEVALYLFCKLCEAEEYLDTGLGWLSAVMEQHVLMNWQTQQKTQFRHLFCMHPHTQVQTVPLR